MPSATYRLFEQAMEERRLVVCVYLGRRRELCPVVLGWSGGREKVLAYQAGGASSKPLTTPETRWRCMVLDEIAGPVSLLDGWPQIDASHRKGQTCVEDVDLDINPLSPFNPRRRLGWQQAI